MIVALLNQKGGVGKTTLATHIAGELALRGQHVVLLDADPQGSALDWSQQRAREGLPRLFGTLGLARDTLHREVPELARTVDHVVIDGPPRVAGLMRSVLLSAAAYNAGPSRANRWIRDYGDPRLQNVNAVDWIEGIPYRETRNYVMRVLEAQFVYRARISGRVGPLTLAAELQQNGAVISGADNDIPSRPPRRR